MDKSNRAFRTGVMAVVFLGGMAFGMIGSAGMVYLRLRQTVSMAPIQAPREDGLRKALGMIETSVVRTYGLDGEQQRLLKKAVDARWSRIVAVRDSSRRSFVDIAREVYGEMLPSLSEAQKNLAESRLKF